MTPRAIVLVAGMSTRIRDVTGGLPKSFLKVGDESLIERTMRLLRGAPFAQDARHGRRVQEQFPRRQAPAARLPQQHLSDDAARWFGCHHDSPFMLYTYQVTTDALPAVTVPSFENAATLAA